MVAELAAHWPLSRFNEVPKSGMSELSQHVDVNLKSTPARRLLTPLKLTITSSASLSGLVCVQCCLRFASDALCQRERSTLPSIASTHPSHFSWSYWGPLANVFLYQILPCNSWRAVIVPGLRAPDNFPRLDDTRLRSGGCESDVFQSHK